MTDQSPGARRWWQVPVWKLLVLPVVCAPVFYYLAMRDRITPGERLHRQWQWVKNGMKGEFPVWEGGRVSPGDPLVILANVSYKGMHDYFACSRCLMPDGTIHVEINIGNDQWDSRGLVRGDSLARLPALLKALSPSDPAARPANRMLVGFPVDGWWTVRSYRKDAQPQAVKDLFEALELPSS